MDHAEANYHLLTYTSWPWHTGLFSITSPETRLQLSFLFLARRAAWLRLLQVRAIMCDWRKCQLLIFPTVLIVGSRAQTSEAELLSPHTVIMYVVYSAVQNTGTPTSHIQINLDLLTPSLKLQHL